MLVVVPSWALVPLGSAVARIQMAQPGWVTTVAKLRCTLYHIIYPARSLIFSTRFSKGLGVEFDPDTITPFGKAFYRRQAKYWVIPYPILVVINLVVSAVSAAFWSIPAVAAAQILRQFKIHLPYLHLFAATWYRPGVMYGLIATCFIIVVFLLSLIAVAWVVGTKWLIIGRRREGSCAWDTHSYCAYFFHPLLSADFSCSYYRSTLAASSYAVPPPVPRSRQRRCAWAHHGFSVHRLVLPSPRRKDWQECVRLGWRSSGPHDGA